MSARQPFVPQRPVSNHPDPKSQTLNANSDADAAPKESKSQANSMDFGPTNKPLNISGLIKPRSSHKQQNPKPNSNSNSGIGTPTLKVRSSFEGIQRPPKPAIFSKNQGSLKLRLSSTPKDQNQSQSQSHLQNQNLQASPFFPASNSTPSSGFLAMSSNATATFGGLPLFQVNANTVSNGKDAHIPTFASESAMTPLVTSNPDSSFEKIQESAEEPPSSPSVTCAVGDASATALGSSGDVTRGLGIAVRSQFESGSGRMKRKNNRVEDEEDQLEEEGVEYERTGMKRWKGDNGEIEYMPTSALASGATSTSTSTGPSTKQTQNRHQQQQQHYYRKSSQQLQDADQHDDEDEELNTRLPTSRQHTPASTRPRTSKVPQSLALAQEPAHALFSLFGTDLDAYVAHRMDEYEAMKNTWATCEAEVWVQAADELKAEYISLLDFVKDHMTTKLSIYATLSQKVKDHKSALGERANVLKDVQKGLMKDGAVLI